MQQGDYTALATEPSFLWAFLSFRAAFLAARSANRLVVVLGGDSASSFLVRGNIPCVKMLQCSLFLRSCPLDVRLGTRSATGL